MRAASALSSSTRGRWRSSFAFRRAAAEQEYAGARVSSATRTRIGLFVLFQALYTLTSSGNAFRIPDEFELMHPELLDELRARLAPYVTLPDEPARSARV